MARVQASEDIEERRSRIRIASNIGFDMATMLGILSGFGLLITAIVLGGAGRSFVDVPSVLIVVGGTLGVTTVCFSITDMTRVPSVVFKTLFHPTPDPSKTVTHMLRLADLARKRGILGLDAVLDDMQYQPFMHKAISMAVDGTPLEEIHSVLQREIDQMSDRHYRSAGVLRKAAEIAPAMGLIGTLIGLVQMLGNLDDPSTIGPGLAVALLTTFYGAVLANMVFAPLAAKLERNSVDEVLLANIYMLSAESICRKENPRRLELLLNSLLPPSKRLQFFT